MSRAVLPITNHSRDFAPNMEKYKGDAKFSMHEDRNHEDYNFLVILSHILKLS